MGIPVTFSLINQLFTLISSAAVFYLPFASTYLLNSTATTSTYLLNSTATNGTAGYM